MAIMLRAGHGLLLVVIALLTFGVVMVNSAGLSVQPDRALQLQDVLLGRPTMLALLSIGVMFLAMAIPVRSLYTARAFRSPIPWIVIGCLVLLVLVHVPEIGVKVNGKRRWIDLGPVTFQPSEIAKWGVIIVIAWHAARRAVLINRFWYGFMPPMFFIGLVCVLIGSEDLGTAVLIGAVGISMLIAAGVKLWHVALLMPAAAAGFVAAVITSPYRINRLVAFLNPYDEPQTIGYHIIQSMTAINGGGMVGRGLGHSIRKNGYLPESTTDFIYAIICEELGFVGAAAVVCLYAALLMCGLSIVRAVKHPFERLLGLGILLTIGYQALINIAVVTGAAPTKGIALPMLSNGGTGWVLTAFSIGLLVSMDRQMAREEKAIRTRRISADALDDEADGTEVALA